MTLDATPPLVLAGHAAVHRGTCVDCSEPSARGAPCQEGVRHQVRRFSHQRRIKMRLVSAPLDSSAVVVAVPAVLSQKRGCVRACRPFGRSSGHLGTTAVAIPVLAQQWGCVQAFMPCGNLSGHLCEPRSSACKAGTLIYQDPAEVSARRAPSSTRKEYRPPLPEGNESKSECAANFGSPRQSPQSVALPQQFLCSHRSGAAFAVYSSVGPQIFNCRAAATICVVALFPKC